MQLLNFISKTRHKTNVEERGNGYKTLITQFWEKWAFGGLICKWRCTILLAWAVLNLLLQLHRSEINCWQCTSFELFQGSAHWWPFSKMCYCFNSLRTRLSGLLDAYLNMHLHIWLQNDGDPPSYSPKFCQWLSENFLGSWIGRGRKAPVSWPARSPDLNSLDFVLWG
jgi:hypothetical protein